MAEVSIPLFRAFYPEHNNLSDEEILNSYREAGYTDTPKQQESIPEPSNDREPVYDLLRSGAKGIGQAIQGAGWLTGADGLEQKGREIAEVWGDRQSQSMQNDLQAVDQAKGFTDSLGALIDHPAAFGDMIVSSLPAMIGNMGFAKLGAMGVASIASKTAMKAAALTNPALTSAELSAYGRIAAEKSLDKGAAWWTAAGIGAGGEGLQSAGMTGSDVERFYKENGATDDEAVSAANEAALESGLSTAALGRIGGKFETDALLGGLGYGGIKKAIADTGKEALEEAAQGSVEDYAAYNQKSKIDPSQEFDLGKSVALNAAAGAGMGAPIAAMGYATHRDPTSSIGSEIEQSTQASNLLDVDPGNQLLNAAPEPQLSDISAAPDIDSAIAAADNFVNKPVPLAFDDLAVDDYTDNLVQSDTAGLSSFNAPSGIDQAISSLETTNEPQNRDIGGLLAPTQLDVLREELAQDDRSITNDIDLELARNSSEAESIDNELSSQEQLNAITELSDNSQQRTIDLSESTTVEDVENAGQDRGIAAQDIIPTEDNSGAAPNDSGASVAAGSEGVVNVDDAISAEPSALNENDIHVPGTETAAAQGEAEANVPEVIATETESSQGANEPIVHAGYNISEVQTSKGQRFELQSHDNMGTDKWLGNELYESIDAAKLGAEAQLDRVADDNARIEKINPAEAEAQAVKAQQSDIDGFGTEFTPHRLASVVKLLNQQKSLDGKDGTVKEHVKSLVEAGAVTSTQVNSGKTDYYVGDYKFNKTAYDYANHLESLKPEPVTDNEASEADLNHLFDYGKNESSNTVVEDSPVQGSVGNSITDGFKTIHPNSQKLFNDAYEAKDATALTDMLHKDNKNLRAEFEARTETKLGSTNKKTAEVISNWANNNSTEKSPYTNDSKLKLVEQGKTPVVGDDWLDNNELPDDVVSIPNPNQIGTKDMYIIGKVDHPTIKAYRDAHGITEFVNNSATANQSASNELDGEAAQQDIVNTEFNPVDVTSVGNVPNTPTGKDIVDSFTGNQTSENKSTNDLQTEYNSIQTPEFKSFQAIFSKLGNLEQVDSSVTDSELINYIQENWSNIIPELLNVQAFDSQEAQDALNNGQVIYKC